MAEKGGRQLSLHRGSYGTRTSHLTRPSTTSKPGARSRPSASGARCERGGGCLCSTTGITHTCMRHSRTKPNSGSDASERWFFNRLCFKLGATLCSAVLFKCTCSTRLASKQATVRERVCVCVCHCVCLSVCVMSMRKAAVPQQQAMLRDLARGAGGEAKRFCGREGQQQVRIASTAAASRSRRVAGLGRTTTIKWRKEGGVCGCGCTDSGVAITTTGLTGRGHERPFCSSSHQHTATLHAKAPASACSSVGCGLTKQH